MKRNKLLDYQKHGDTILMIRNSKANTVDESPLLETPFIEWCKQLKIKTEKGLKPFDLFDWQADFSGLLLDNPRIPITLLSSRQTGKTALVLALLVWLSLSRYQFTAVVTHRKGDDTRQLARRCKKFIPDDVKLESDSLSLIEFAATGSQLHFRSCNPRQIDGHESVGRGLNSVDLAVIEEASHTGNVAEIMTVLGPCLTWSPMATVLQIGTAGRRDSYFYDGLAKCYGSSEVLEQSLEGIRQGRLEPYQVQRSDSRISVVTNWRSIPRFADEPDYLARIAREQDLSESQINSEHELKFDSDSTLSAFDFKLVEQAQSSEGFEDPEDDAIYYSGVDGSGKPRPGRKGDYTVCLILKKLDDGKLKLVNLYRKRGISFERRYHEICETLRSYKPVFSYVEAGDGLGQTYLENIHSGCPSLDIDRFATNDTKKAGLVGKIELALERGDLIIPKCVVIDELLSFAQLENGKFEAVGKNAHDDSVLALGFALQAARYGIRGIYD